MIHPIQEIASLVEKEKNCIFKITKQGSGAFQQVKTSNKLCSSALHSLSKNRIQYSSSFLPYSKHYTQVKNNMKQYNYEKMDSNEILSFMFFPRTDSSTKIPGNADDQHLKADEASLHIRYHMTADKTSPVIIFFHGNGEIVSDYDDIALIYNEFGISFIGAEYRGYGLSTGSPSATNMIHDAHRVLDAVVNTLKEKSHTGALLVMGRSLGCAPAIELASCHQDKIKGLLLDSSFAFTLPVLKAIGVDVEATGIKEEDCFRNIEKIKTISFPTYMIHGQRDTIIDMNNATELQMESPALQKEFQTVPGADHNNLMDIAGKMYFEVMLRFIKKMGKMRKKKAGVR